MSDEARTVEQKSFERWRPDLLERANRAIDAYNQIVDSKKFTHEALESVLSAAASDRRHLRGLASDLLGKLATKYSEVREAIIALQKDRRWGPRFTALCCLNRNLPPEFMIDRRRAGLVDKSSEVRAKAGDQAMTFDLKAVIPDLGHAVATESDDAVRESLEFSLPLLRDGYLIRDDGSDSICVTVRAIGIASARIDRSVLQSRPIEEIVAGILDHSPLKPKG